MILAPMPLAPATPANQRTPCCGHTSGAWLSASAPPARIRFETPSRIYRYPVSIDCMPEPQLICTVKATILSPMPSRSAATRAGFISSAMTLTQPRIT